MKWRDWLTDWGMSSLKISTPFLDMEFKPQDEDRNAAWELYIELLTRVATQPLAQKHGDEKTALDSVHALFPTSRETIKKYGPRSREFTKIAIVVLNQVVRPFTAKWHRLSLQGAFQESAQCTAFREEARHAARKIATLHAYAREHGRSRGRPDADRGLSRRPRTVRPILHAVKFAENSA